MRGFSLLALLSVALSEVVSSEFKSVKQYPGGSAGALAQVVLFMKELSHRIEAEGQEELASYDKYSCWCEDTLARKAKDISGAKEHIDRLQTLIEKLSADIAAHGAEIENINKLIADNMASTSEAEEVRGQDAAEYANEKSESEQCIGALEAAIRALAGAGTKKGFLETLQEAQLLSVASSMDSVLKHPVASQAVSTQDLAMVRDFFQQPTRFEGRRQALSAVQLTNNPFGDYAPQSTRIQGVLKGLYDAFTASLEKANVAEAEAVKSFQGFMATKMAERATLTDTLERQELSKSSKAKDMAESKLLRQDTQSQLKADEEFFASSKKSCQAKAKEWSERVRMRTEELQGIDKAIGILSSEESTEVFQNSSNTLFVQVESETHRGAADHHFAVLESIAKRYHSQSVARIAAAARAKGYFDKVITDIDGMIALLRKEEQMDILHRDRCQNAQSKNTNDKEDLQHDIDKADAAIKVMEGEERDLQHAIGNLTNDIKNSKAEKQQLLDLRNTESEAHKEALAVDAQAVELITQAIESMAAFYKRYNIVAIQMAKKKQDHMSTTAMVPEYAIDPDRAPETSWSSDRYAGRQTQNAGLTAILEMIKEDIIKEMDTSKVDDAAAQKQYEEQNSALRETIRAQEDTKAATEKDLAALQTKMQAADEYMSGRSSDLDGENALSTSIYNDCSWVESHFETRATKRTAEMSGLSEAKNYLAGVEDGSALDATFG